MSQDFSGKRVVVTGATRGIGEACARRFAQLGGRVALVGRDQERLGKLQAELPHGPITIAADLGTLEGVDSVVDGVMTELGGIDVLVNNAGVDLNEPAHRMTAEAIDKSFDINVRAVLLLASRFAKALFSTQGNIVNISSISSQGGAASQAAYAASKGAVESLTLNLALDWGSKGVRVNCVSPGLIETEMWDALFDQLGKQETMSELAKGVSLGRWGSADEIASVVCFLASDEASYVSGQILTVNGAMA